MILVRPPSFQGLPQGIPGAAMGPAHHGLTGPIMAQTPAVGSAMPALATYSTSSITTTTNVAPAMRPQLTVTPSAAAVISAQLGVKVSKQSLQN